MNVILRRPKILLKTRDAVYPVMVDGAGSSNPKGTAFATKYFPKDSKSKVMVLAFNPSSDEGINYYIDLQDTQRRWTRLTFPKHPDRFLIVRADTESLDSLLRKTLKLDVLYSKKINAQHTRYVKMYSVQTGDSGLKKYLLTKVENSTSTCIKYKLNDGERIDSEVRPIGAPVFHYPRESRWRKSTKKLIGMVQSVEDDGKTLSVLHLDNITLNQILNGNTSQLESRDEPDTVRVTSSPSGNTNQESRDERDTVRVTRSPSENKLGNTGGQLKEHIDEFDLVGVTRSPPVTMAPTSAEDLISNLHVPTRQNICKGLNVERCTGGDYKTLAGLIDMPNGDIRLLKRKDDPADEVLIWWERRPNLATITNLRAKLLDAAMQREDLVAILDQRPRSRLGGVKETSDEAQRS